MTERRSTSIMHVNQHKIRKYTDNAALHMNEKDSMNVCNDRYDRAKWLPSLSQDQEALNREVRERELQ